ncbi:MAG: DHH family phosphoesterase [Candidatus Vogelbacteria bacterium]|nr:DHH family phosphoesterase [Candidatus Vogelbacteria bacterium]
MTDQVKKLAPEIWRVVQAARRVLLILHPKPDPDSVGSNLAFCHLLRGLGKEATLLKGDSPMPGYLSFLPGYETIVPKNYLEIYPASGGVDPADFDLFLVLDLAEPGRISHLGEVKFPSGLKTVLIDHHKTATPFCQINLIAPDYPATAQILFDLFKLWSIALTPEIAACLFVGLYTDTGGFQYPRTTSATFLAAAKLAAAAPNFPELIFQLENNNSPGLIRFQGLALSSIELFGREEKVALVALSLDDLRRHNLRVEDTQGVSIANILKSVKGWAIGAEMIEREPGLVTLSLRTRDPKRFDVSRLAVALGGGGHPAAAGAALKMPFAGAKELFLQKLGETYPEFQ